MPGSLAAFLIISILVIVTPGQDTVLTVRNALIGGRRGGAFTALGVATGQALWTLAASAGVAALLLAARPVLTAVRLAGAAYLVFLGVRALRDALRGAARGVPRPDPWATARLESAAAFRQGFLSNLSNPKMAIFFTSLLPQFVSRDGGSRGAPAVLGLVFCSMTLAWLSGYAVIVARAGDLMHRPAVRRAVNAAAGVALVLFGAKLAVERR